MLLCGMFIIATQNPKRLNAAKIFYQRSLIKIFFVDHMFWICKKTCTEDLV